MTESLFNKPLKLIAGKRAHGTRHHLEGSALVHLFVLASSARRGTTCTGGSRNALQKTFQVNARTTPAKTGLGLNGGCREKQESKRLKS
jgi:hypothetical protein